MEFMRRVCWPGDDTSKWCRYVRLCRGVFICGKGTAAGIKHSQRIDRMLAAEAAEADQIVFDSGSDLCPKDDDPRLRIHAGDNCEGRAGEFIHLIPEIPS